MLLTSMRSHLVSDVAVYGLTVLRHAPTLLPIIRDAFEKMPESWVAPELLTMLAAIVYNLGPDMCAPYLETAEFSTVACLKPMVESSTPSTPLAAFIVLSLASRDRPPEVPVPLAAAQGLITAARAVFSGQEFCGRHWGPAVPITSLSLLARWPAYAELLVSEGAVALFLTTLQQDSWEGHAVEYSQLAHIAACEGIAALAAFQPDVASSANTDLWGALSRYTLRGSPAEKAAACATIATLVAGPVTADQTTMAGPLSIVLVGVFLSRRREGEPHPSPPSRWFWFLYLPFIYN
jgi:hypothetical protein